MTEVTLKVLPKAESERTLVLRGLDEVTANRAMTTALGSSFDVSGVAHLPASIFRNAGDGLGTLGSSQQGVMLVRLEGIGASVADRAGSVKGMLASFGTADMIEDDVSASAWTSIRDVTPFAASGSLGAWPVWRIVCPPASGGAFGQALARETGGDVIYDWGGGLIWAALPPVADAHAALLRQRLKAIGGHATLLRATDEVRGAVDVFQPQEPGVAALGARVKASFDPRNIFNRGRMVRA